MSDIIPDKKRGGAHPNPLESFDPRMLALILKGTREQVIIKEGYIPPGSSLGISWGQLRSLNVRLSTLRKKQFEKNPEFGASLYRATIRMDMENRALIIEPRDIQFDGLLKDITKTDATAEPLAENVPTEVKSALEDLADFGKDLADE